MQDFRSLPSVDEVVRKLGQVDGLPASLIANEVRAEIAQRRCAITAGEAPEKTPVDEAVLSRLHRLMQLSLRPVINATGVILHTNLGRAPLPELTAVLGYSNLEYDLDAGTRGKRDVHTAALLERLLGRSSLVVNNNAAAVYLVLNELAAGYEVIVSRGELIEIGDGFRIPEIMARSGAVLHEVGTTNRTRIDDYRLAVNDRTRLIMRVHPSNFRVTGFTERPALAELVQLGRERGIPVYEDLGSGCVADLRAQGIDEPLVSDSLSAGCDLVSFSGDKLLGGPQAGVVAGDAALVKRIRKNPMYRAFRVDKLIIGALEVTLRHLLAQNWAAIPTLRMIFATPDELRERAERVRNHLSEMDVSLRESESPIGGGSTPDQTLPTWVVEIATENASLFERRLRTAAMPVVARIERQKLILDMRTIMDDQEATLVAAVKAAAAA